MTSLNVPPTLKISYYLLKNCKLWVWDFDDTIINTQTYLKKDMKPNAISRRTDSELDTEVPQWRYFRRLVEFLVEHGRYVAIASFGTYEIIQAYMNRIMGFNQKFFTKKNIIAPNYTERECYRFNVPPNKNEYIYTLMRVYRVQDFKRVVLFDDNASNIADAIAIGIVGVQIPTPGNGDQADGNMFFGPWIMDKFDKGITDKCGEELYLNRTFTGMVTKEDYNADAFGGKDIDYGRSVRSTNGYTMERYDLTDRPRIAPAFGTGIGDRKINTRPQFRWNAYRNNKATTPQWWNGNYTNVPGLVKTEGYWDMDSLGGNTMSFWDEYQKVNDTVTTTKTSENELSGNEIIEKNIKPFNKSSSSSNLISEGFENNSFGLNSMVGGGSKCTGTYPSWLLLILVLVVLFMIILVSVVVK